MHTLRILLPIVGAVCVAGLGCYRESHAVLEQPRLSLSIGRIDRREGLIDVTMSISNVGVHSLVIPCLNSMSNNGRDSISSLYDVGAISVERGVYIMGRRTRARARKAEFAELKPNESMIARLNLADAQWYSPFSKDRYVQHTNILDAPGVYEVIGSLNVDIEDVPLRLRSRAWTGVVVSPTCTLVIATGEENADAKRLNRTTPPAP